MADQDDFEPGGRCWKKTRQAYLEGVVGDAVAFSVERVLKKMIGVYGESAVLPQVVEALQHLAEASFNQRSLWSSANGHDALGAFEATLMQLEPLACDRRIDAVILRTARSLAAEPGACIQPEAFVARTLSNVARHCCLDEARACSIGMRFSSDSAGRLQAHAYHQELLQRLRPGVEFLARQYLRDPSGQHLRCRPRPRSADLYSERLA